MIWGLPRITARRLAAVAGVVGATVVLVATASAVSFTDPEGDVVVAPEGAVLTGLDITGVEVTNARDRVTFRVTLAGAPALPPNSTVAFALDTDKNRATGDEGTDAIAGMFVDPTGRQALVNGRYDPDKGDFLYAEWDGAATYQNGTLVFSFPRFALNGSRGFTFAAVTVVSDSDTATALAVDVAPDDGSGTYDLVGLPSLLKAERPVGEPTRPRAGDRFTVTSFVIREDTYEPVRRGKISCLARVGSTRIRAVGSFTGVGARCAMTIPRNARGKMLSGAITVQAAGATVKRSFAFRIT